MAKSKLTVMLDPDVIEAVRVYQKNLIKESLQPVSFSKALNGLLRGALEDAHILAQLEDVEK